MKNQIAKFQKIALTTNEQAAVKGGAQPAESNGLFYPCGLPVVSNGLFYPCGLPVVSNP